MWREPITSTTVASIGFDHDAQTLDVEFVNGRVYRYFGVTQGVYEQLKSARSPGAFVNFELKGRNYRFTELA